MMREKASKQRRNIFKHLSSALEQT